MRYVGFGRKTIRSGHFSGKGKAIVALGKKPRVVHLDNSRAARSRVLNGSVDFDQSPLPGIFEQLDIRVIFSKPYHPQGKAVLERFFRTFGELERRASSYTGGCIADKPARLRRNEVLARKVHEIATGGRVPTVLDFYRAFAGWLDAEYGARPQRGHLKGKTPQEMFMAGRGPGFTDIELLKLRIVLLPWIERTIGRDGIKMPWRDTLFYSRELYGMGGQRAIVKYDLADPDRVWVFSAKSGFLCEAVQRVRVHRAARHLGTEADREELSRQLEEQGALKKQTTGPARELVERFIIPEVERQQAHSGFGKGGVPGISQVPKAPTESAGDGICSLTPEEVAAADLEIEEALREQVGRNQQREVDEARYLAVLRLEAGKETVPADERRWATAFERTFRFRSRREFFEDAKLRFVLENLE